ncbi:major facilitator superfamily domain-containing protein [Phaeosphaeriaceae sp. PMI808]|nr:major facilitator superfamily domain-containing protein [Phaeosphaeriaceae sp. PMI808]
MPPHAKKNDGSSIKASDETEPLLAATEPTPIAAIEPSHQTYNGDENSTDDGGNEEDEQQSLPRDQIFLLCFTAIVEPIAFFAIFPYINFMIEKVGNIEKAEVGFYSGLIESLFSATQMCVMVFWGKASDRYGRKPILVISLVGVALATALFGMSQSLWQMIVARCFAGLFSGTIITVRAMLSENSTKHTQASAFSYFAFARNLGLLLGPVIGGGLESPATKYPGIFGSIQFLRDFPYALPCLVTALIFLFTALTTLLFVKETLHLHHARKKATDCPMSTMQLLRYSGITQVIIIYNYVMLLAYTFTAVSPVYLYTPVQLGGTGFTPQQTAAVMSVSGAAQAVWLLLVFPRLHKRVGTGRLLFYCACLWPIFFASNALFNILLRYHHEATFWSVAPPTLVIGSGVAMAFTAVQLAINDIAPSHETLGTLNAIVLAVQSGIRAVAPAASTSIYAIGVKHQILGGQLFWLLNTLLAFGLFGILRLLPTRVARKAPKSQHGRA